MACTIFEVNSLTEQIFFRGVGAFEHEFRAGRLGDAVLNSTQLDVEYLPQVMFLEAAEHDDLIDAVHKLG